MLDAFFSPTGGNNFEVTGCAVQLKGSPEGERTTIFAKVGVLLADEPAVKEVLECKGHGGTKSCVLCLNAVLHKQPKSTTGYWERNPYFASISDSDFTKFIPHTDLSIRRSVEQLNEAKRTLDNTRFEEKSKALGFTYNPYSCITRLFMPLQVVSILMWDWVHCYICDGLADQEFGLVMHYLRSVKSKCTYDEIRNYLSA